VLLPVFSVYAPALQGAHAAAPGAPEKAPAQQGRQVAALTAPTAAEKVPAGQGKHAACPATDW
jgi:hypothetical protein